MPEIKKILVRMPNWLGDMVMASSFIKAVQLKFPVAETDVIVKKGLDVLIDYIPGITRKYIFSKKEYPGARGAKTFGKNIRKEKSYDLFFCLPDSLSSAVMGKAIKAGRSIGFRNKLRFFLLSDLYRKPAGVHRTEEYISLLENYLGEKIIAPNTLLQLTGGDRKNVVININSEAGSRRLPIEKAVSIINLIRASVTERILLTGTETEKPFVDEVYSLLQEKENVENVAGTTSLPELIKLFASSKAVVSTDSGPAHVANALGTPLVVLFGAGNENNTAPFNAQDRSIIRLGKLACEPCVKNECRLYGVPECLLQLDENMITEKLQLLLEK